jgi:DNA-binding CsgD family transcriptional regulator
MSDAVKGGLNADRRFFLCVAGLALLLAAEWSANLIQSVSVEVGPLASTFLSPRAVGIVVFLCGAVYARRVARIGSNVGMLGFTAFAILTGRLLSSWGGLLPAGTVMVVVGDILYGAAEAFLLLVWLSLCCKMGPRQTSIVFPLAYLLVGFTYFILLAMDSWAATLVLCTLPCLSALLCAIGWRTGSFADLASGALDTDAGDIDPEGLLEKGGATVELTPASDDSAVPLSWKFPFYPVALMVIFKFVFYFSLPLTAGPSMFGPLGILVIATFALLGTVFFFEKFRPSILYKLALPCMVLGLLLLAWVDVGSVAATMATNAGNIAFELFILITLAEICYRYGIDAIWMFGIVEGFSSLAATVGFGSGSQFVLSYPAGSFGANVLVLVIVVLLVALSTFFFNDRLVSQTFGTTPVAGDEAESEMRSQTVMTYYEDLVWRCSTVARQYGLSHREEEILELLAQGMSGARIEEELFISKNTVKTHVHHIYEKLGVHSRDEARAIVEGIK